MTEFTYPLLNPVKIEGGVVRSFQGANKAHLWPSNFFISLFDVGGVLVPSVEHYYQAMKTLDRTGRETILAAATPGVAKRLGRSVVMRPDWEQIKNTVMLTALHEKFHPGSVFAQALLATGHASLVEGNYWHDNVWGDCVCGRCSVPGENRLGRMLERQRAILRAVGY